MVNVEMMYRTRAGSTDEDLRAGKKSGKNEPSHREFCRAAGQQSSQNMGEKGSLVGDDRGNLSRRI